MAIAEVQRVVKTLTVTIYVNVVDVNVTTRSKNWRTGVQG
jgi:hypothetical protein